MRGEQIISITFVILGVAMSFGGITLGLGTASLPGPGFFPLIAGLSLTTFAGFSLYSALGKNRKTENSEDWRAIRWRRILLTFVALTVYANILDTIGFIISTLFILILLFRLYEYEKWVFTILKSLFTTTVVYVVFDKIFQLNLPRGIFGF